MRLLSSATEGEDETSEFKYFDKLESFIESLPLAEAVDVLVTGGEISIKLHLFEKVEKILRRIERKRDVNSLCQSSVMARICKD